VIKDPKTGKDIFDFEDIATATGFTKAITKLDALAADQSQTMSDTMESLTQLITTTFSAPPLPSPTPTPTPTPTPEGGTTGVPGAPGAPGGPAVTPTPVPPPAR